MRAQALRTLGESARALPMRDGGLRSQQLHSTDQGVVLGQGLKEARLERGQSQGGEVCGLARWRRGQNGGRWPGCPPHTHCRPGGSRPARGLSCQALARGGRLWWGHLPQTKPEFAWTSAALQGAVGGARLHVARAMAGLGDCERTRTTADGAQMGAERCGVRVRTRVCSVHVRV